MTTVTAWRYRPASAGQGRRTRRPPAARPRQSPAEFRVGVGLQQPVLQPAEPGDALAFCAHRHSYSHGARYMVPR
ncbi:MAG: hypothetical protein ABSF03_17525 [Streptosporangiaceae bacterium]